MRDKAEGDHGEHNLVDESSNRERVIVSEQSLSILVDAGTGAVSVGNRTGSRPLLSLGQLSSIKIVMSVS